MLFVVVDVVCCLLLFLFVIGVYICWMLVSPTDCSVYFMLCRSQAAQEDVLTLMEEAVMRKDVECVPSAHKLGKLRNYLLKDTAMSDYVLCPVCAKVRELLM